MHLYNLDRKKKCWGKWQEKKVWQATQFRDTNAINDGVAMALNSTVRRYRVRKTKLKFLLHGRIASRWVFLPGASNSAPGFSAKRAPYFELVRTTTMAAESRTTTWPRERLAERLATMNKPSVDHVRAVINALYDESNPTGKEKASEWLQELQRSVSMHAKFEIWSLSFDTLDQNFRSFFVRFPFSLI